MVRIVVRLVADGILDLDELDTVSERLGLTEQWKKRKHTSAAASWNESSSSGRFLTSSTSFGPQMTTSHWSSMATLNTEP